MTTKQEHRWGYWARRLGCALGATIVVLGVGIAPAAALTREELFRQVELGRAEVDLVPLVRDSEPLRLTEQDLEGLRQLGVSQTFLSWLRDRGHVVQVDPTPVQEPADVEAPQPPSATSKAEQAPASSDAEATPPADEVVAEPAPAAPVEAVAKAEPQPQPQPEEPPVPVRDPRLFHAPAARIIPAGVIYTRTGIDTGGAFAASGRIGLGDVSEFGIDFSDEVRVRECQGCDAEVINGFPMALFRLGVNEGRLWSWQPGMVLGFRKSFQVRDMGREIRLAELSLVFSKDFGDRVSIHAGAQLWDGEIRYDHDTSEGARPYQLNEDGVWDQLRPYGAVELRPLERSVLVFEVHSSPELEYAGLAADHDIDLEPVFSWGVRNEFTPWLHFDAGVRIPNIGDANLLDAQIFGQANFILRFLHELID